MEIYNILTIIIILAAVFGYINVRLINLPGTIGIMLISLMASLAVIGVGHIFPQFFKKTTEGIGTIDFHDAVNESDAKLSPVCCSDSY